MFLSDLKIIKIHNFIKIFSSFMIGKPKLIVKID